VQAASPVDQIIGNFRIVERLGRGAMGEVWLAEQTNIGTRAAIKLLRPELSEDRQQVQRFFNEAVAVSKIKHAGITKIFDVGFHDGQAYLLMELLEGETLAARLAKTPRLPIKTVYDLVRQIATILDATHTAGIVHRDLKPDNVFLVHDAELASRERAKVLDFGIAKLGNSTTITGTGGSLGTPAYMSPEQWKNSKTVDARADIYALGCVAFQMACGRPPFLAESVGEACLMHMSQEPPSARSVMADIPAAFDKLLLRMLAKDPAERPSLRDVLAVLDGAPAPRQRAKSIASDDTVAELPAAKARGGHRTGLVILALVLVGVAGGAFALWHFVLAPSGDHTPRDAAVLAVVPPDAPPADAGPPPGRRTVEELLDTERTIPTAELATLFAPDAFGYSPHAKLTPVTSKHVAEQLASEVGKNKIVVDAKRQRIGGDTDGDVAWIYQDVVAGKKKWAMTQVATRAGGEWQIQLVHRAELLDDAVAYQLAKNGQLPALAPIDGDKSALSKKLRAMFESREAFIAAISDRDDAINIGSAPGQINVGGGSIKRAFKKIPVTFAPVGEVRSKKLSDSAAIGALQVDFTLTEKDGGELVERFRVTVLVVDNKLVLVHWSNGGPFPKPTAAAQDPLPPEAK